MGLILCIETATRLCSVALGRDGVLLAMREVESERGAHAEKVNVFMDEVLLEAGAALSDIDAVAVGIGPGSYTGLRIGLSAAKGLCYGLDVPIIGISTLTTLVHAARKGNALDKGTLWPMVDARRMEVFTQEYDGSGQPIGELAPLILDEAWAAIADARSVFGDGADKAEALWAGSTTCAHLPGIKPHAGAMLGEAEARLQAEQFDDLAYLVPTYGKAANLTAPRKSVR